MLKIKEVYMIFKNTLNFLDEVKRVNADLLVYVKEPLKTKHSDFELIVFSDKTESKFFYVFCPKTKREDCIVFKGSKYLHSIPVSDKLIYDLANHEIKDPEEYEH